MRNIVTNIFFGVLGIACIGLFLQVFTLRETMAVERAELREEIRSLRDSLNMQKPGLGEYMSTIQLHTAKLWFAGINSNWELARYEHNELVESMESAERLHTIKNNINITEVLESVRLTRLPSIDSSITHMNSSEFTKAYEQTLDACKGCHKASGYGFIHVTKPKQEPVTNQEWKVIQ